MTQSCPDGVRWCSQHDDGGQNDPELYRWHRSGYEGTGIFPLLEFRLGDHNGIYNVAPVEAGLVQHIDENGHDHGVRVVLSFFEDDRTTLDAEGLRRFADWLREKAWLLDYIDERGIEVYPGRWRTR